MGYGLDGGKQKSPGNAKSNLFWGWPGIGWGWPGIGWGWPSIGWWGPWFWGKKKSVEESVDHSLEGMKAHQWAGGAGWGNYAFIIFLIFILIIFGVGIWGGFV